MGGEHALKDPRYDFDALLKYDPEVYSSFPEGWDEMDSTRVFFEHILRLARVEWKTTYRKPLWRIKLLGADI